MEELGAVSSRRVTPAAVGSPSLAFPVSFSASFVSVCLSHCFYHSLSLPTYFCVFLPVSVCVFLRPYRLVVQGGGEDTDGAPTAAGPRSEAGDRGPQARGVGLGAELPVGPGMAGGFRWAQDGDWGGGRAVSAACRGRTVLVAVLEAPQAVACGAVRGGGMSQAALP